MPETPSQELIDLILHGREERNLEYKESMSWKEADDKVKITRCILGMSNIRDGGSIVLGVEDQSFEPVGMDPDHFRSFNQDDVDDFVAERADPFVEIEVTPVPHDGKEFIVIQVKEFEELPVICRKETRLKNRRAGPYLRRGATYVRSRRKRETVEVPSQTEMREIIDLAVDKGVRRLIERMGYTGILNLVAEPSDVEKFDQQLGELS